MKFSDLPDKEYVHAAVVDRQPITLESVIAFALECEPLLLRALKATLVILWVILLASLVLGRF